MRAFGCLRVIATDTCPRQSVIAPTGYGMTLIAFARTNTVSFP